MSFSGDDKQISVSSGFFEAVYAFVSALPKGKVTTYGDIAKAIGRPAMAKYVGFALHANPSPDTVPCYKVVNREGKLASSFAFGGAEIQRLLLEKDGIEVKDGKVDLSRYRYIIPEK